MSPTPLANLTALTDELFALAIIVDLLKAQPPHALDLLERGEGAITRSQALVASLREWAVSTEAEIEAVTATLQ